MLKQSLVDAPAGIATLCIESTVTVFDKISSSDWLHAYEPCTKATPSPAPPILKYLRDSKNSDVIIECGGVEFPVHSVVLACEYRFLSEAFQIRLVFLIKFVSISPVFSAMMHTDMKEAASGRI